jgi:hypothetical protein
MPPVVSPATPAAPPPASPIGVAHLHRIDHAGTAAGGARA